jgi:hypothetical protein
MKHATGEPSQSTANARNPVSKRKAFHGLAMIPVSARTVRSKVATATSHLERRIDPAAEKNRPKDAPKPMLANERRPSEG